MNRQDAPPARRKAHRSTGRFACKRTSSWPSPPTEMTARAAGPLSPSW